MNVRYPKVSVDNKKLVYVSFTLDGKRIRLYNGRRVNSPIDPNRYPLEQRIEVGKVLASDTYKFLINGGELLPHRSNKQIKHKQTDVEYLKEALDLKLKSGYSEKYIKLLSYSYRLLEKESSGGKVSESTVSNILTNYESGVSYNTIRKHIKVLVNEARRLGMGSNPLEGIKPRKSKARLNRPFDDVGVILGEIQGFNKNLHLCCLLTYGCLLRPHREIRELCWEDFSQDLREIRLSGNRTKSGKNRIVPVPSYIREHLKFGNSGSIFEGFSKPPGYNYFKTLWGRFKKTAVSLKEGQTLYSFRHSGAIEIFKRTGSISKVQKAMGHSSLNVSLTYLRGLEFEQLKEKDMPNIT